MARSRKFFTVGALGVASFALIGSGATATFNTATQNNQTITAGEANVVLTSPDVPGCTTVADECRALSLPPVGAVGSTFLTSNHTITIHNIGDIPVDYATIQMSESHNRNSAASNALLAQTNVCIMSTNPRDSATAPWNGVEANGPMTTAVKPSSKIVQTLDTTLEAKASARYWIDFYAGTDSACGSLTSSSSNTAEDWGVTHDATKRSGDNTTFYTTPESLTDAAQGGVITPKVTFTFTG